MGIECGWGGSRKFRSELRLWQPVRESVADHGYPGASSGTLFDGFAKNHFVVSGFEGRKCPWGFQITRFDVSIKIPEELNEGVRVTLRMAAGISGVTTRLRT